MKSLREFLLESNQEALIKEFKRKYSSLYKTISHSFKPEHSTLVVSMCGATKNEDSKKEKINARDMYIGPANQTLLKALPGMNVDWIILSGGYGTMWQTSQINFYTDVIMDLSTESLRSLKDFTRYQADLEKHIKKGNYKQIILTLSATWLVMFDLQKLQEAAGDKCEIITFLPQSLVDDDEYNVPDSIHNIKLHKSYRQSFGASEIFLKEKITTDYLKYLQDYPGTSIDTFLSRKG